MECPGCSTEMVFNRYLKKYKCPVCAMEVRSGKPKDPLEIKEEEDEKIGKG